MSGISGGAKPLTCKHLLKGAPDCVFCHRDQLRQELSLAEEGLANYAQENAELRRCLDGGVDCAEEKLRLKAALERIKALRYGLELHSDPEERAEYWSGMALEYRRIAAEALRPAEPQTAEQK